MWSSVYLLHGVLAVLFLVYQTEVSHQTSGVVLSGHSIPTLPESNKYIVNIRSKWFYTKVKYMYYISNITTENSSLLCSISSLDILKVQLFSTNALNANTSSLNVLPSFTAIYSTSLHTFIKENKYFENDIGFIRIKPIVWE